MPGAADALIAAGSLGHILRRSGRVDEAEAVFARAFEDSEAPGAARTSEWLELRLAYAVLLAESSKLPAAEKTLRDVLADVASTPFDLPELATRVEGELAEVLRQLGRPHDAEPLARRCVVRARADQTLRKSRLVLFLARHARIQGERGAFEEATAELEEAISLCDEADAFPQVPRERLIEELAAVYDKWGKPAEAARVRAQPAR